jgi:hypothetical protein
MKRIKSISSHTTNNSLVILLHISALSRSLNHTKEKVSVILENMFEERLVRPLENNNHTLFKIFTMLKKVQNRLARAHRVRARITGTAEKPRLSVFRSNTHISVQAIDDATGITLLSAHDMKVKKGTKTERAKEVGDYCSSTS